MSQIATQGKTPIYRLSLPSGCAAKEVVFFRTRFHVDVDGSKHAYGPHNTGTDYTANAGEPDHWWALVCDKAGRPIIDDGFYISTTSLQNLSFPAADRRRYVDAESIPYIVLPAAHYKAWGVRMGDLAWVQKLDERNQVLASGAAIFADAGPDIGEGSAALARQLGLNPDPRRGGTDEPRIQFFVFPGSGNGRPLSAEEIDRQTRALLPALKSLSGLSAPIVG